MQNSGGGFNFGGSQKTQDEEQKEQIVNPVTHPIKPVEEVKVDGVRDKELEEQYTDNRSVTIALVKNYSLYRKVNDKVLPKKTNYIGSSYYSSQILSSNKTEVETYFPALLGISPNNESFVTRVKNWLNNIQVSVDELGKTFNTSFVYNHKRDYYRIKEKEDRIEEIYQAADKTNIKKLKEALKEKITSINTLESSKCLLGHPVNLEDYLLYRHCLLYNDVAKELSLINSDQNIRFYFKDDKKEADKAKKLNLEKVKAKENYIKCYGDPELFEAVYIQYCVMNNMSVLHAIGEDKLKQELTLDKFSTEDPIKFNKICNNKDCKLIGTIEKLIARGELIRLNHNQNITTVDGQFIGSNMGEAISWFKNPENSSFVNAYYNKLNTI